MLIKIFNYCCTETTMQTDLVLDCVPSTESVWLLQSFPRDVLERIFVEIPLECWRQVGLVCKRWSQFFCWSDPISGMPVSLRVQYLLQTKENLQYYDYYYYTVVPCTPWFWAELPRQMLNGLRDAKSCDDCLGAVWPYLDATQKRRFLKSTNSFTYRSLIRDVAYSGWDGFCLVLPGGSTAFVDTSERSTGHIHRYAHLLCDCTSCKMWDALDDRCICEKIPCPKVGTRWPVVQVVEEWLRESSPQRIQLVLLLMKTREPQPVERILSVSNLSASSATASPHHVTVTAGFIIGTDRNTAEFYRMEMIFRRATDAMYGWEYVSSRDELLVKKPTDDQHVIT